MRDGKQLLLDSRPYAQEDRLTSWWVLLSTLALFLALQAVILTVEITWVRVIASLLAGLTMVRLFIVYHDYEHDTILKKSWLTWVLMKGWGLFTLNPPSIWRRSHNHHHKHNAKLYGASIGSFPMMTVAEWEAASPGERRAYAASRHPLVFLFGYLTVFIYGMCLRSLIVNPRLHADSALALFVHAALLGFTAWLGWDEMLLCMVIPAWFSAMLGSYLFYAQHNFPDVKLCADRDWDYVTAALHSSSYMKMSPIMAWFTGNIGYHHVHHLNHHIPFYRLPETMADMPELQSPGTTSLKPWDVWACLRLKLWDEDAQRLVPFPK